jgi:hypothetical protein
MDASSGVGTPVDFNTDDMRILLITSAVNPASNVATWDDVTAMLSTASVAEVSGTNYARKTLAGEAVTLSTGTVTIDASDPAAYSQSASSGFSNARYAILYKYNASDASAGLVAYYDFGANKGNTTGSLTLEFSAAGIFTFA